eukprot:CAMPEP_0201518238 /NCGR_PEP_ID=MMETSP0161_2-20130828/9141_1 /ASSEMBLY_ACC=CAM_ASM_000251 /TAXON_ID=180227 /ORGANISM="Neoparamoeba aestuarina, Strain SoJaBio B1-5/56/2" /LENGTH=473 /DNA_ID=CAMNT_0047915959 /DNA_START=226 /DNA_END=1644 /DNA_ORIENTATION=+
MADKKGLFSIPSKKSKKASAINSSVTISGPTSFRTGVHVDRDFTWQGDPKDAFELQSKLGEGAYGSVYKAIMKSTQAELAIKNIKISQQESESIQEEMKILKECRDKNIVCYYGCAVPNSSSLWILMDLCEKGSVLDLMKTMPGKKFNEDQVGAFMGPVLSGLSYLHSKNIIHRDIKAANILVTSSGEVKIGDFGISAQISEGKSAKAKTIIGTPLFMAPEVIDGKKYTHNSDVWSLGITAIECAEGKPPRDELSALRAMYVIVHEPAPKLTDHEKWSQDFYNFVSCCLQKNPTRRPPAQTLEKDPWIEKSSIGAKSVMSSLLQNLSSRKKTVTSSSFVMEKEGELEEEEIETEGVMERETESSASLREERVASSPYLSMEKPAYEERESASNYLTLEKPSSEVSERESSEVEERRGGGGYLTLEKEERLPMSPSKPSSKSSSSSSSSSTASLASGRVDVNDLHVLLEELAEW